MTLIAVAGTILQPFSADPGAAGPGGPRPIFVDPRAGTVLPETIESPALQSVDPRAGTVVAV